MKMAVLILPKNVPSHHKLQSPNQEGYFHYIGINIGGAPMYC